MKGDGMFDERDVLLKAASIVEEGWCQGKLLDGNRSCAMGAIFRSTENLFGAFDWHINRAMDLLEKYLHLSAPDSTGGLIPVAEWNDTPGRTADEVAAAMREAAL